MKHSGKTTPFRGPGGETIPGSLHGGPGFTEMRLFRHFNAPLEKCFTVVNWDQRGAGKSFDRNIQKSSMTVEQFIADLDELVDTVWLHALQAANSIAISMPARAARPQGRKQCDGNRRCAGHSPATAGISRRPPPNVA